MRAVGNELSLSGLRACTTYRLTLEVPPVVRNDLLESARFAVNRGCRMHRETMHNIAIRRAYQFFTSTKALLALCPSRYTPFAFRPSRSFSAYLSLKP